MMITIKNLFFSVSLIFVFGCASNKVKGPETTYLYVMSTEKGSYKNQRLTLNIPSQKVSFFSDRPVRKAGKVSLKQFIDNIWTKGKDSFAKDSPNAGFSFNVKGKGAPELAVIELSSPKLVGENVIFTVKMIHGRIPKSFRSSSLYIDIDVSDPYSDGY